MEVKTAIILAGGFGTRLQSVIKNVPKPMAPVNGIPFLNYQINYLKHFGINQVILSVGYLHSIISEYYKNEFNGVKISYAIEETALGTGGGIRQALELSSDELVLALNGDSFFDIPLNDFAKMHEENKSQFSLATRKVVDASRYGTIETDVNHRITSFKEKDINKKEGIINAGIYLLNKTIFLQNTNANTNFSIEKDFFEKHIHQFPIFGFQFNGYFIDIGIPEDYNKAQNDFKEFKYR